MVVRRGRQFLALIWLTFLGRRGDGFFRTAAAMFDMSTPL
jgi:hypothetical protein